MFKRLPPSSKLRRTSRRVWVEFFEPLIKEMGAGSMAPADARCAGLDLMREAGEGWQAIPRLHAGAVLASELAETANAGNPDSGVPTPSAPASLPFWQPGGEGSRSVGRGLKLADEAIGSAR